MKQFEAGASTLVEAVGTVYGIFMKSVALAPNPLWRVLIVDDHAGFLALARERLEDDPSIQVAAAASSAEESWALLEHHRPDALILDMWLPGMNGLELCRQVKTLLPKLKILLMSESDEAALHEAAMREGAIGFLNKKLFKTQTVLEMLGFGVNPDE